MISIVMSKARERVRSDAKNGANQSQRNGDLERKIQSRRDRQKLVLWRSPVQTFYYFTLELVVLLRSYGSR